MTATAPAIPELAQRLHALREQLREQVPPDVLQVFSEHADSLGTSDLEQGVLPVGRAAPRFILPDATGRSVALDDLLALGPVVVTFYRGAWCPYCNTQLHALQEVLPQISAAGATLVAISPQAPDSSLTLAERHGLTFHVLSDARNAVAHAYGLVFALTDLVRETSLALGNDLAAFNGDDAWEVPIPATFVLDRTGDVRWVDAHADYRERTEPQAILDAIAALDEGPSSRQTVDAFFAAFGRGDIDAVLELFHSDGEWYVPGDAALVPWAGLRVRARLREFFALVAEHAQPRAFRVDRILADGPDVVALGHFAYHFPASGGDIDDAFAMHFTVAGEKIRSYRIHEDSLALARAVSGSDLVSDGDRARAPRRSG